MPRWMRRVVLALALSAMMAAPAWADSTWTTAGVEQTHAWTAASGAPSYLEWARDGSRLLVLGTGGPRTIQLLDRQLAPVGVVEAPFDVRGASWSMTGRWLMAWGPDGDRDALALWDVPSLAPNATFAPRELLNLTTIDAARFYADDVILVVAGRDANATSRINVVETTTSMLLRDLAHPENRTVRSLWYDGRQVLCVEEGGRMRSLSGSSWDGWDLLCALTGEVTAQGSREGGEWLAGDANGVVRMWSVVNGSLKREIVLDSSPVQAIAWVNLFMPHFLIATPGEGAGSRLQVWRAENLVGEETTPPILVDEYNLSSPVRSMDVVPGPEGNLTVGHQDGRVAILHVNGSIVHWPADDEPPPPPPDGGDGGGDGDGGAWGRTWWKDHGYLVVLVLLLGALTVAYVWLARRAGRDGMRPPSE